MVPLEVDTFTKSCGIGAAIAAPVGPMCVLLMRRTLSQGVGFGLATGVGIAAGDGVYALIAAFGLRGIMRFMAAYERPLHFAAGAVLVYLGWRAFFASADDARRDVPQTNRITGALGSALLLTLTNPPTIVSFMAVFTALAPAGLNAFDSLAMAGGVFAGSLLWWLFVTALAATARRSLGPRARR